MNRIAMCFGTAALAAGLAPAQAPPSPPPPPVIVNGSGSPPATPGAVPPSTTNPAPVITSPQPPQPPSTPPNPNPPQIRDNPITDPNGGAVGGPAAVAGVPLDPNTAATTALGYRAKSMLGSRIYLNNNLQIGVVDDIVFGESGMIDYLIVLTDGRMTAVPWMATRFNFQDRSATVGLSADRYRAIPTFGATNFPTFDGAYRTRQFGMFGLAPSPVTGVRRDVPR